MNWKLRKAFTGNNTSDVQTINGYIAAGEDNDFSVEVSPVGKEYPAPLVVPRTNLLLESNQFDTTWVSVTASVTSGQSGYDGSNDAWLLSKSAASGRIYQNASVSGVATYSVYAKRNNLNWLFIIGTASSYPEAYFDLLNGTIGNTSGHQNFLGADIKDVGNGWHRCSITFNDSLGQFRIYPADGNNNVSGTSGSIYIQDAQLEAGSKATEYIPTTTEAVTRSWDSFSRVQNQVPGICNGIHTHTGAASGGGIAATTLTGTGSGGKFKYQFDTLGKLVLIEADDAGQGYRVDDKLSITTNEGHDIEFRLVEGSNATTVTVGMEATKPSKPVPFPVTKMRVADSTDRRVLIMDQRSRYVFPKPTPYLLDTYEGAAAAYSLRRLRSAYTGPAVRVRRESNNDELDIYFDGQGNLDTASLEAFCAGTNGFVKVWYDQSPGGNDTEQTVTANQPKIVSSGSVITENGKPALEFDGSSDYLQTSAISALDTDVQSSFNVATDDSGDTSTRFVWRSSYTSGAAALSNVLTGIFKSSVIGFHARTSTGTYKGVANALPTNQGLISTVWNSSDVVSGKLNGVDFTANNDPGADAVPSGHNFTRIGANTSGADFYWQGTMQEIILYPSDQTSNLTGIETNINDFYNIY
jgi:hypothetical protein